MQLQNFSPDTKYEQLLAHIASHALPPKELAAKIAYEADQQITKAKSDIENVRKEIKSGGTGPHIADELLKQEAELDAAWDELHSEIKMAKEGSPDEVRTETVLEEERTLVLHAKEIVDQISSYRVEELFYPSEEINEQIPGMSHVALAKNIMAFRDRYGETLFKTTLGSFLQPGEIQEFIEIMATTDTPPLPEDFKSLNEPFAFDVEARKFLNAYKLIRPGTKEEKIQLLQALAKTPTTKNVLVVDEDLLEGQPHPGDKFLKVQNIDIEEDDAEFTLQTELKSNLPKTVTGERIFDFEQALASNFINTERLFTVLEAISDHPLNEKEKKTAENMATVIKIWLDSISEDSVLADIPAAQSLSVHHEVFNKDRTIPPFVTVLKKKLAGPLMGFMLQEMKNTTQNPDIAVNKVIGKASQLFNSALKLFSEVQTEGVPGFKKFTHWLDEKAAAQYDQTKGEEKKGTLKEGEFHIGRDTLTSTYVARMATQWGKMSGAERRQAIKHVDISRVLIDSVPRAVLAEFLKQNKLNDAMMGIDGGYTGTGPQDVLLALMTPERRKQMLTTKKLRVVVGLDEQVRLLSANSDVKTRASDPSGQFGEIVFWMEGLPKFTERSQQLIRTGTGDYAKYLIVTQEKDASEQILAWVVQHAVWRGIMTPGPSQNKKEVTGAGDPLIEDSTW